MLQYQSLIGAMQWVVSIGCLDITTAVMTLSSFRAMPRHGHLDHVKCVYGCLSKMKEEGIVCVHTDELDYSRLPKQDLDWATTVYGNISKLLPTNALTPLGKYVTLTNYFDANLYHDMLTGCSITGLLHLLNKTPIDWYSKKQESVGTATYGSEFIATCKCLDQVIDLCKSLHYLGVPIHDTSFVFGDNKSMVNILNYTSTAMPYHSTMSTRLSPPNTFLCIIFLTSSTQPISLPNTRAIHKSGAFFSHSYSIRVTLLNFLMTNLVSSPTIMS
jgi:hypothetical protein